MKQEFQVWDDFIQQKGLRQTHQRKIILSAFLDIEKHLSCAELYKLVQKKDQSIGYVTVYRTMKLLSESGLCGEIDFGDGILRFEHKYQHQHHDHLICIKCGRFFEVREPRIERLQNLLAQKYKFKPSRHKLQIFGICRQCQR